MQLSGSWIGLWNRNSIFISVIYKGFSLLTTSNFWVTFPWTSNRKTFPKWVPSARNWNETKTISFKRRFGGAKSFADEEQSLSSMGRAGIGWAWRQNCEIAEGGKALFIKAYSVKWHFPPFQIKMLKHNKYTVHLTSSQDPKCNPITFLPSAQSLFLFNSTRVSGFCASIKVRVWVCVYASPLGHKNYRNRGLLALD